MENQKKSMTAEQYFALRCEVIRRRNSAEVVFFMFMVVGISLIAIGEAMNKASVNTTAVVMVFLPLFLLMFFRSKTKDKLDRLRIEYSRGASFEYVATIKLNLMEEKIKEEKFTPGAFESQ